MLSLNDTQKTGPEKKESDQWYRETWDDSLPSNGSPLATFCKDDMLTFILGVQLYPQQTHTALH